MVVSSEALFVTYVPAEPFLVTGLLFFFVFLVSRPRVTEISTRREITLSVVINE